MCTVTVLPGAWLSGAGRTALRVVFSRDERRQRRLAHPPMVSREKGLGVIMPIDGDAGGTWIAANTAGLVFALLNVTAHVSEGAVSTAPHWPRRLSRGAIIPALCGARDLHEVAAGACTIDACAYAPFDLVCVSAHGRVEVRSDGARLEVSRVDGERAWLRTSSSLGDCRVVGPRRRLFDAWFRHPPFSRTAHDEFHRHYWAARRELSVLMERPDARTVSITTVECGSDRIRMDYEDAAIPEVGARSAELVLQGEHGATAQSDGERRRMPALRC